METPLTIKQVEINDWPIILAIERSALSKFYSTGIKKESVLDYIKKEIIFLAFDRNRVAGKISYTNDGKAVNISGLIVLPEWRGKGIGKWLSKYVIDLFPKIKVFTLTVHPENQYAIKIYKKLGFENTKLLNNPYGDGEPRLLMELKR